MAAVLVMGVSGCGKTTIAASLAERLGWRLLEGDSFHPAANVAKMQAGVPLTDEDRWPWLRAIAEAMDQGGDVVIACSALKRAYRAVLIRDRDDVRLVYLQGSRALITRRLTDRRGHFMPPALLDSQFTALEEPGDDEKPIVVPIQDEPSVLVERIIGQLKGNA